MDDLGGPTHYEVLGVRVDASVDEIRRAYRTRAKTAHPDAGGGEAEFRRILSAYETLTSPLARRDYDARLGVNAPASTGWSGPGPARTDGGRTAHRRSGPDETQGWNGRHGGFTGDVEFPGWLRDVTDQAWSPGMHATESTDPPPIRPANVEWWSHVRATGTPVVTGTLLLVTTGDAVVALDALTGQEVWRAGLATTAAGPPVVSGEVVVLWTRDGDLHGLDLARGVTRWQHRFGAPGPGGLVALDAADPAGPVVAARQDARLMVLDPATGQPGWTIRLPATASAPVIAAAGVVVVPCGTTVEAVEGRRGRSAWRQTLSRPVTIAPLVLGSSVWIAAGSGVLHRLALSTGARGGIWDAGAALAGVTTDGGYLYLTAAAPAQLVALDRTGTVRWVVGTEDVCPEPALADGLALLAVPSGRLVALRAIDGQVVAEVELPFRPAGPPLAVADQVVVLRETDGKLWAVGMPR